jgi:hypothetical protein
MMQAEYMIPDRTEKDKSVWPEKPPAKKVVAQVAKKSSECSHQRVFWGGLSGASGIGLGPRLHFQDFLLLDGQEEDVLLGFAVGSECGVAGGALEVLNLQQVVAQRPAVFGACP